MAQTGARHNHTPQRFKYENVAVSVPNTGNSVILDVVTEGTEKLYLQVSNTVQALAAFVIQGKSHPDAAFEVFASAAGDYSAPDGRILRCVGAPVTLAASAVASIDMDISGLYQVQVLANGGNATPSVASIYASGSNAGQSNANVNLTGADTMGLTAGEAHVGAVGGNKKVLAVEITRENNATPYGIGDVVSAAAATVVPAMDFATAGRVAAGTGYIVGAKLIYNVKSVVPRTRVHLFNVNTATVSGDNLPWSELYADSSKRIGYFDLPAMVTGADSTNSDMSRSIAFDFRLPYICAAASQHIYAVLETLDAVTLTALSKATLTLMFEQD